MCIYAPRIVSPGGLFTVPPPTSSCPWPLPTWRSWWETLLVLSRAQLPTCKIFCTSFRIYMYFVKLKKIVLTSISKNKNFPKQRNWLSNYLLNFQEASSNKPIKLRENHLFYKGTYTKVTICSCNRYSKGKQSFMVK